MVVAEMGESEERRELLARYFEQLREAGEDEICVSPEAAATLRAVAAGGTRPASRASTGSGESGRGRSHARSGARASGGGRADPASEKRRRPERTREAPAAAGRQAAVPDRGRSPGDEPPDPEVVEVSLGICRPSPTRDMFASSSPIDACGTLEEVEALALACEACELARTRTKVVFGAGNPRADLMFIGEAPGRDEDLSGVPFVGRAGKLLDKVLDAAGIERDDVYIGNIIKCRPPNNRTPLTSEIEACAPYLKRQLEFIRPKIVCTLGLPATQTLLGIRGSMGGLRGKIYCDREIRVIPTYHPAAALRDPKYKRPLWEDFLVIRRMLERI